MPKASLRLISGVGIFIAINLIVANSDLKFDLSEPWQFIAGAGACMLLLTSIYYYVRAM